MEGVLVSRKIGDAAIVNYWNHSLFKIKVTNDKNRKLECQKGNFSSFFASVGVNVNVMEDEDLET